MKTTTIKIAAIAIGLWGTAALAGNYILTINGKQYELDLGEPTTVTIQGDQKVQLKLEKKDVVVFKASTFSFSHPSSATPARTDLGDGLHQTMMAAPTGTLVMIQEYSGIDPSGLIDLMLTELTKEEAQYGYEITKEQASKTLSDGRTVTGKRAISKYQTTEYERWVVCYGAKDAGILIITQVEKAASRDDVAMIDLFWKTMTISMK
jgi:hypothetical protein